MTKAKLRERFHKLYKLDDDENDMAKDVIVDMMNFFGTSTIEDFYDFIKEERNLTDEDINTMDL